MSSQLLISSIQEARSTSDLVPLLKDFRNSDNASLRVAEVRDTLLSVARFITTPEAVFWYGKCWSWFATPAEGQELCAEASSNSSSSLLSNSTNNNSILGNNSSSKKNSNNSSQHQEDSPSSSTPSLSEAFIYVSKAATTPESVRMLCIAINNICCNEKAREKFFANSSEVRDAFLLMARPASATVSATDVWCRAINQICNDSSNGKSLFAVPQFSSIMIDPIAQKGLLGSVSAGNNNNMIEIISSPAMQGAVQHWAEVLQSLVAGKSYPGTVLDHFATPDLWKTIQIVAQKLVAPVDPEQAHTLVASFRPLFEKALLSVVHHSPEYTQGFLENGLSPHIDGPRGGKLIHQACGGGRIPILKVLVKFGVNLHELNEDRNTPLHQACSSGNAELVQFLLEHGASPSIKNAWNETPLDVAKRCQRRQALRVMEEFAKNGKVVSVPAPSSSSTTTTLPGLTIGGGATAVASSTSSSTPPSIVSTSTKTYDDDKEVNEYLRTDTVTTASGAPIIGSAAVAVIAGAPAPSHHDPVYEQNGGDASLAARQMKLFDLVSKGKTRLFAKLDATKTFGPIRVDEELKDRSQMMHVATQWEQLEFAELLLKRGAAVDCKDSTGQQPLHRCAAWNRVDGSEWLLRNGAKVNALDAHGRTPLMYSALYGHAKVTQYLLQHGGNKDLRDHNGKNARTLAEDRQNKKVVRLLDGLPVTIDNNTVTFDPVTNVVHVVPGIQSQFAPGGAFASTPSSSLLPTISVGGTLNATSPTTTATTGTITTTSSSLGSTPSPLGTPSVLTAAAASGTGGTSNTAILMPPPSSGSSVPLLVPTELPTTKAGAVATATSAAAISAIAHLGGVGNILTNEKYTHNQMLLGRKIVKLANNGYHEVLRETILHQGADVNFKDPETGRTALHAACAAGNFLNTRVLLDCGADVSIRNADGDTARDLAIRSQRKRVLEVFQEYDLEMQRKNKNTTSSSSTTAAAAAAASSSDDPTIRFLREQNEQLTRANRSLEADSERLKQENEALKRKLEEIKKMFNY